MPLDKNMTHSDMVKELMLSYKKTGRIGKSYPNDKEHALKIANAVAYSIENSKDSDKKEKEIKEMSLSDVLNQFESLCSIKEDSDLKVGDTARYNGSIWVKIKKIDDDSAIVNPIHKDDVEKGKMSKEEKVKLSALKKEASIQNKNEDLNLGEHEFVAPFFDGFYESIYTGFYYHEEGWGLFNSPADVPEPLLQWCIDNSEIPEGYYDEVAKTYLGVLDDKLNEILPWGESQFVELDSPKEYNFTTDRVIGKINITEELYEAIFKYLDNNKEAFAKWIKDKHSSYSGFVSFYSDNSEDWLSSVEDWDYNEFGSVLGFILLNENGEDIDDEMNEITNEILSSNGEQVLDVDINKIEDKFNFDVPPQSLDDLENYIYDEDKDMYIYQVDNPGQQKLRFESYNKKSKLSEVLDCFEKHIDEISDKTISRALRARATRADKAYAKGDVETQSKEAQHFNNIQNKWASLRNKGKVKGYTESMSKVSDEVIKARLEAYVREKKKTSPNPNWFNGFSIIVKNGVVSIEKNGIESERAFIYKDGAKDGHGKDWNTGALGNLVIYWEQENKGKYESRLDEISDKLANKTYNKRQINLAKAKRNFNPETGMGFGDLVDKETKADKNLKLIANREKRINEISDKLKGKVLGKRIAQSRQAWKNYKTKFPNNPVSIDKNDPRAAEWMSDGDKAMDLAIKARKSYSKIATPKVEGKAFPRKFKVTENFEDLIVKMGFNKSDDGYEKSENTNYNHSLKKCPESCKYQYEVKDRDGKVLKSLKISKPEELSKIFDGYESYKK